MSIWFKVLAACFGKECDRVKEGGEQVFRWWKEIVGTCKGTSLGARVDP